MVSASLYSLSWHLNGTLQLQMQPEGSQARFIFLCWTRRVCDYSYYRTCNQPQWKNHEILGEEQARRSSELWLCPDSNYSWQDRSSPSSLCHQEPSLHFLFFYNLFCFLSSYFTTDWYVIQWELRFNFCLTWATSLLGYSLFKEVLIPRFAPYVPIPISARAVHKSPNCWFHFHQSLFYKVQ